MSITKISLEFILEKEIRAISHLIKNNVFKNDGILYGEFVRDEIIAKHYKDEFFKKNKDYNNESFWYTNIDTPSSLRVIVSTNISIYFKNNKDYSNFIEELKKIFEIEESVKDILYVVLNNTNKNISIHNDNYILKYIIGKTFTYPGKLITISIMCTSPRCIMPCNNITYYPTIEPPFNNIDMLCNIFIHSKEGIRLTKNSGTQIDNMNDFERAKVTVYIMKQIIHLETEIYVNTNIIDEYTELSIVKNIIKIINNKNKYLWKITNLPFNITDFDISQFIQDDIPDCCICQDSLGYSENDKKIISTYTINSSGNRIVACQLHCSCMMKYLSSQLNKMTHETVLPLIKFVCPYNSNLNFLNCKIDYSKMIL